jgi:transcription initiation factor TFIID TATA-box-binding protein
MRVTAPISVLVGAFPAIEPSNVGGPHPSWGLHAHSGAISDDFELRGGSLNRYLNGINTPVTRIRIENVVASASLGDELDLHSIALSLDGAEYEPEQFPGVIYRLKQPKTAILLFRSGKVVCTGGKSMNQVNESIRKVSEMIRKGGQKILATPKTQVQNIVATSDLESEINLNSIAITLGLDRVEYEPEQFPGLVCRMENPRVVVLLFGSGKLVCTGARRPSDVTLSVEKITKELQDAGLLRRGRNRVYAESSRVPRKLRASVTDPATSLSGPTAVAEASAAAFAS